jgi:hypothetical protein
MIIQANTTMGGKHLNQFPFGAAAANCQQNDFGKLVACGKQPATALHTCFDVKSIRIYGTWAGRRNSKRAENHSAQVAASASLSLSWHFALALAIRGKS